MNTTIDTASAAAVVLAEGLVYGAVSLWLAYRARRYTGWILGLLLGVAGLVYVGFSAVGRTGPGWLAIELLGVVIYGGLGALGIRRSRWYLVAGWMLHPVWDLALHFLGPGRWFTPDSYSVACFSYDLLVALVIALRPFAREAAITATRPETPALATTAR